MAVGAALGGVIGYERDRHRRPVGLRTHLIVALTAATFMVVSSEFVYYQRYRPSDLVEVDTSRIAASVVSAVGFLAGGAILRTGLTVQGLTTAAGIWLVTAIGMSAGAGMYVESCAVTLMGLVALTLLRRFEDKHDHLVNRRLRIVVKPNATDTEIITDDLRKLCTNVRVASIESLQESTIVVLDVRLSSEITAWQMLERLRQQAGVEQVRIESLE